MINFQNNKEQQTKKQTFFQSFFSEPKYETLSIGEAPFQAKLENESQNYIRGMYLYGTPGCGKTYLMDLFYESLPIEEKQRVHFNEFMLEIQKQIHFYKQKKSENALKSVAEQQSKLRVLCLDEFQVTDICDALILKSLFEQLFSKNIVLLATSNRMPDDLYKGGLQRFLFEPFIPYLYQKVDVVDIVSNKDYRYCQDTEVDKKIQTFIAPNDSHANQYYEELFQKLSQSKEYISKKIQVMEGRLFEVKKQNNGVALFNFEELCEDTLGASDFIAIARNFKHIIVRNVPIINSNDRNATRRFILLVDEIYNNKTKLYISAQRDLANLFLKYSNIVYDEQFALERTYSRLVEMQSKKYMDENAYYDKCV